jgi:hypothetical protein
MPCTLIFHWIRRNKEVASASRTNTQTSLRSVHFWQMIHYKEKSCEGWARILLGCILNYVVLQVGLCSDLKRITVVDAQMWFLTFNFSGRRTR